jgi:ribosomal protein S18 acetylase RimI-like enzyme
MDMILLPVKHESELEELVGKKSQYSELVYEYTPLYIERLKELLQNETGKQLFLRDKETNEFVGYVVSSEELFPDYQFIHELFIEPIHQKKGHAQVLVQEIIDFAKKRNNKGVIVETEKENIPAQKLYTKLGFARRENAEWVDGETFELLFEN